MSKTRRRIEITAFRRQRLAITAVPESPVQPSTTDVDEDLAGAIRALVKQLTDDTLGAAKISVSQKPIGDVDDHENEVR